MIKTLYKKFQPWSDGGSIWIISDFHFEDLDCKLMNPNWITPEEQVNIVNKYVNKNDTLICLGDVGNPEWIKKIKGYKVLITGNHDKGNKFYKKYFDEIFNGPLFISKKILLTHEPLINDCYLNIHGHVHNADNVVDLKNNSINVAADVVYWVPLNLKNIINSGILNKINNIHTKTIEKAKLNKINK